MRLAMHDDELPEVLIQGNENPSFPMRQGQNLVIAWILSQAACPNHIEARKEEFFERAAPYAGVEKNFQDGLLRTRSSTRSWPTSRLAYTKQA